MPSRMIREGMIDSEALHRAGEAAEVLFTRLMLVADDYGRFDGRVSVICRRCWPLGGPDEASVNERLCALAREALVMLYEVGGKSFICIPKFHQRLRLKKPSKWPDPPKLSTHDSHMPDTCPTDAGQMTGTCPPEARSEKREVEVSRSSSATVYPQGGDSAGARCAAVLESLKPRNAPAGRIEGGDETPAGELAAVCIANGIRANAFHPLVVEWAREGVTVEKLRDAIVTARTRKGDGSIPPAYLDPILRDGAKPAEQPWRSDDQAAIAKGRELGIEAKRGEDFHAFRRRIDEALHQRARRAVA